MQRQFKVNPFQLNLKPNSVLRMLNEHSFLSNNQSSANRTKQGKSKAIYFQQYLPTQYYDEKNPSESLQFCSKNPSEISQDQVNSSSISKYSQKSKQYVQSYKDSSSNRNIQFIQFQQRKQNKSRKQDKSSKQDKSYRQNKSSKQYKRYKKNELKIQIQKNYTFANSKQNSHQKPYQKSSPQQKQLHNRIKFNNLFTIYRSQKQQKQKRLKTQVLQQFTSSPTQSLEKSISLDDSECNYGQFLYKQKQLTQEMFSKISQQTKQILKLQQKVYYFESYCTTLLKDNEQNMKKYQHLQHYYYTLLNNHQQNMKKYQNLQQQNEITKKLKIQLKQKDQLLKQIQSKYKSKQKELQQFKIQLTSKNNTHNKDHTYNTHNKSTKYNLHTNDKYNINTNDKYNNDNQNKQIQMLKTQNQRKILIERQNIDNLFNRQHHFDPNTYNNSLDTKFNQVLRQNKQICQKNKYICQQNQKLLINNKKVQDTNKKLQDMNKKVQDTNRKLQDMNKILQKQICQLNLIIFQLQSEIERSTFIKCTHNLTRIKNLSKNK